MDQTLGVAEEIASMPVESLVATKKLLLEARLDTLRPVQSGPPRSALLPIRPRRCTMGVR